MGVSGAGLGEAEERTLLAFIPDTEWPPYFVESKEGHPTGLLPDLFRELTAPLGYDVQLVQLPNKRGWIMLDSGEVDMHLKAREWVPNADDYDWSDPLFDSEDVLLYRKGQAVRFEGPADLAGMRIAVVRSFVYPGLDEMFESGMVQRIGVDSPFAMLDLVALDRADAAVVNRAETLWLFRNRPELHGERFELSEQALEVSPYRFVFTKKKNWAPFIQRLNEQVAAMKADGRLDAILQRYR